MKDEIKEKITYSNVIKNTVSRVTNDEKEYEKFLRFWSRGNMTNIDIVSLLHIYEENPNVYVMLSYNEWKKAGYQVLAGKKAIRVGNLKFFNNNDSETEKSSMRYVFSIDDTIKKTKDYTILFPDTHEFKEIAGVNNENYNRSFGFELKLLDSYITEYNIFASENDEFIKDTCRFILESRYAGSTGSYNFSKCKELYNEPVKLYNTLNRVKEIVGNFIEKFTEMNISNKIESTRDEYPEINENDIFANYHLELHEHLKKILNSELTDDVKKTFLQRVIKRVNTECKINGLKCSIFYEKGDIFCRIKSNYSEFTKKVDMDKLLDRSISIINNEIKEVKINDNEQPIADSFINVYDEFFSYAVIARLVANGNQNFLYFVNNGSDFEKYPDELKNILVKEKNGYVCEKSEFEDIAEELNLKFIADNKTLNLTAIKFALNDIGRVEGKITKYDIGIEPSKKDEKGDNIANADNAALEEEEIKHKFSYSNEWSLSKSLKEKFYDNINAIITLKNVEKSKRNATLEEQEILSKYIGWGGLSEAFDNTKDNWKNEYNKLLEILNDEEYEAAKKSVNTSFYTNKEIINAIYSGLSDMGFNGGNILEPAMGVGNFFSAMPLDVREKSKLFGVEIDDISGRIAKILHPDADISICGFEDTDFSNNTFDCIIGNVPFGDFGVYDKKYNKHNLLIHDYFIAKSLDIVRPGGIVAFITSTGTLDKKSEKFRKYIAERAELLGAVRLPNNAFKDVNTVATSDIIFLKKREKLVSIEPMWVHTGLINQEEDISINMYYHENYNNLLGTLKKDNRFGTDGIVYLEADKNRDYKEEVKKVIASMDFKGQYTGVEVSYYYDNDETDTKTLIKADPKVKNHTYTVIDDNVYYRNDSVMQLYDKGGKSEKRIKGLIEIKSIMKTLINEMINNCDDDVLIDLQKQLGNAYDNFVKENGYINVTANEQAFKEDVEYPLLCSLEDKKDEIYVKSDIFTKRTIKTAVEKTECESSFEALNVCIGKYAKVDMNYISSLLPNKKIEQIISDLKGEIFKNPLSDSENINEGWESKEEYLSGNVRKKLEIAKLYNKENQFDDNISALQTVVPTDISAGEITGNIGCHWIDKEDYEKFINELFDIKSIWDKCKINKYDQDNLYSIDNKIYFARRYSTLSSVTYGTRRMSAVEIYEDLLNNKIIEVRDRVEDENGNVKYVRNAQESQFAQEKAELINDKFKNWLFSDVERREYYVSKYNNMFNSEVVRKFDGSNIELQNHSVDIELRPHQKDAIARIIRGGNTLLAHCVGAGKTYCMIAGCMELKRLGFANKPLMVVPSHLTKQTADEFLKLYPSANILLTTTKDFQKHNRKVFVSKIATGDYDAVIIGHSQFDLIPVSKARKEHMINREIEEVKAYLDTLNKDEKLTVKQLNSKIKKLELSLKKLSDSNKDDTITFEELGVDALFVDEAHEYKNLSFNTRLGSKVAGINTNGSERAYDMYMKVEYIQEKTPGRNVVFATGTPISNSLAEMYTMQKYLGKQQLEKKGLMCFDAWASMFGKIETSWEVAPEGGGNKYRAKTRFARFNNVAELNRMYRAFADVRMADSINLDVPKLKNGDYTIVETELTDVQAEYMQLLMERAEMIHIGNVDPADDNMLKICNEARLVAADPRLILNNENLDADYFGYTKLDAVVDKVYEKYIEYNDLKATQAIMSDIGTPGKKDFDIYNYIKLKLIEKGIPEKEIMFIHDANDDKKKADLFDSLRKGDVRIIIGSTSKMGTGTNIQDRLCAMHEIDVPWRPSDVEQREGRIIRQGNMFDEVEIFRYITKGTFDSYNWNVIEKKQRYISQIMTSDINVRECDDIDEVTMSYAQMKAVCSGNPDIQREIEVEADIIRLKALKSSWQNERYTVENKIDKILPKKIQEYTEIINNYNDDIKKYSHYNSSNTDSDGNVPYVININKNIFTNKDEAGKEILRESYKAELNIRKSIGFYKDFELKLLNTNDIFGFKREIIISGKNNYHIDITNATSTGISIMLENKLKKLSDNKADVENKLEHTNQDLEKAKISRDIPFAHEEELKSLLIEKEEIRKRLYPDSGELSEDNNLELNNVKARAAQI